MKNDSALDEVVATLLSADPDCLITASVLRDTFDQLYDGQHTGRFRWDQLSKTEKTHFGTIVEINLRRRFDGAITDGGKLDFRIAGHDVDCKYSQKSGSWMIPKECIGKLALVCTADDSASRWSIGVVRTSVENLRTSTNRDAKTGLSRDGMKAVRWLHHNAALPPNVLLRLDAASIEYVMSPSSGNEHEAVLRGRLRAGRRGDLAAEFALTAWTPVGWAELGEFAPIPAGVDDRRDMSFR